VANPHIKYYKAKFTGIFYSHEHAHLPFYHFHQIEWEQLQFDQVEEISVYDAWELNTNNSWYRKVLKPYKNMFLSRQIIWRWPQVRSAKDFPWMRDFKWQLPTLRRRPQLVIPINEQWQLQETLHEVVLKQISLIDNGKEWFGGLRRVSGIVYFQIQLDPPKIKKPVAVEPAVPEAVVQEPTVLPTEDTVVSNIWSINQDLQTKADVVSPIQQPLQMTTKGNRRWRWFILAWLLLCLWKAPALFVPSLLIFGAIAFFRYFRKACLGLLSSLVVFAIVGFLLARYLDFGTSDQQTVKTEDGTIKILPPKPTNDKDLRSEKQITWWDFIQNKFELAYATSATMFYDTQSGHAEKATHIQAQTSVSYYQELYAYMQSTDAAKLDSIVLKFRAAAQQKNLNAKETAEMVCTFVQEIPYFLVHDYSCQKAVAESGSGFLTEYHSENKPCLPEIPGGVQSPYEFMHNLKGDCDTRSLYAFTILKELGIPASVWISETYGHSVLGVGLPVGNGFYKEINGVKHYAVELTAKGFRLGMISPEQQIQGNWDIALFYNR